MRVDPNYVAGLSYSIGTASGTEQRLTQELSSGLRVATLSDDPVAASSNVLLASSLAGLDAFVQSSTSVQSRLQATDTTLGEVVSQTTAALSLAVQAQDGTLSAANLAAVSTQLKDIRDQVLSLANTSYQGNYLFSGSQGNIVPFTLDTTTSPAGLTYNGDTVTTNVTTPDGWKVQTNLSGSSLFSGVLGALNQLVADVGSGVTGSLAADTAALTSASAGVSTQRSVLGSSLSRLTATTGYAQTQQAQLQAQQSDLLSANPATVATDLKTAEVQHQALLAVVAAVGKTNLFDYLK